MRRNPTQHSFTAIFAFFLFLTGVTAPLHAQWQPNGLVLRDVVHHHMMLPAEDGGHWVIYDTPLDLAYYCGHVQKYDADGIAQFPGHGGYFPSLSIINPFGHNAEITGAILSDSGSIIVGFESTTLRAHIPDSSSSMYAQKISSEGELVWGDSGVVAMVDEGFQSPHPAFPAIFSDGDGGFWGFYLHMPTTTAFLYGVNADGSQKFDTPVAIRYDADGLHAPILMQAHPDGSVYVVYEDIVQDEQVGLFMQRFSAEGEALWEDPTFLMPRTWQFRRVTKLLPDNSIVLMNAGTHSRLVILSRIAEDGTPIWDPYLDLSGDEYSAGSCTEIDIMPDTSLVFLRVRISGSYYENRYYRVTAAGTPYFGDDWYITYTPPTRMTSPYMGIMISQNPQYAFTYGLTLMPGMAYQDRNILVQLLDTDTAEDCFSPDTVLVSQDLFVNWNDFHAILANDNSLIVAAMNPDSYSFIHMFKVLTDGTVVGHENAVHEDNSGLAQPSSFTIQSLYPNPFNSTVAITLELPNASMLDLTVTNLEGREIDSRTYSLGIGRHELVWEAPSSLASGVLFFRFEDGKSSMVRKVIFEK